MHAHGGPTALVVATTLAACADATPPCWAVEQRLATLAAADRARAADAWPSGFAPGLEPSVTRELAAPCRAGRMAPALRRCLHDAHDAFDVDRCVARLDATR